MATKKRTISAEGRAAMSRARKGKAHPHKGHSPSAATRAKIAAALKGRKRS
jgi:hypothetical protein